MARLEGSIAVVTGGTRGIGEAIATAFAGEGASVVVCSRKAEGVAEAVQRVSAAVPGAAVTGRVLHVGRVETIAAFWEDVAETVGVPDVLVNNAGTNPYFGPMLGAQWPAWDKTFDVNLKGPFEMARHFCQRRFEAGGPGSVINISSILGSRAAHFQGVYGMTKAALISLTQTLALELGQTGIRVNAIAPGFVDTKLAAAISNDPVLHQRVVDRTPQARVAQPAEIAGMAVFLASQEASFVTGQTFYVDGGYTIS